MRLQKAKADWLKLNDLHRLAAINAQVGYAREVLSEIERDQNYGPIVTNPKTYLEIQQSLLRAIDVSLRELGRDQTTDYDEFYNGHLATSHKIGDERQAENVFRNLPVETPIQ